MTVIEPGSTSSDLVGRASNACCCRPRPSGSALDAEPATIKGLYVGYVCILAAIPPLAGLIGGQVFGIGGLGFSFKPSLISAIIGAVVTYGLSLLSVFLVALIIDALAPSFDGQKDPDPGVQGRRLQLHRRLGVRDLAGIFPPLGIIAALASLYGFYLLYLGLPKLMKAPEGKGAGLYGRDGPLRDRALDRHRGRHRRHSGRRDVRGGQPCRQRRPRLGHDGDPTAPRSIWASWKRPASRWRPRPSRWIRARRFPSSRPTP